MAKYQTGFNNYQITKFIVTKSGDGPFTTIQLALDTANLEAIATGIAQTVFIRPGTYTENLTLYSNVNLVGDDNQPIIIGHHTPPASGTINFFNINFQYPKKNFGILHDISTAGTTDITFHQCNFLTGAADGPGYYLYLIKWTGPISFYSCTDSSTWSSIISKGAVTNTSDITIENSQLGTSITASIFNGNTVIKNSLIGCTCSFSSAGASVVLNSNFDRTIDVNDTATLYIIGCYLNTASQEAVYHASSQIVYISDTTIDSNAFGPALIGTGTIKIGSITFITNSTIDPALTINYTTRFVTGELKLSDATVGILKATAGLVSATALDDGELLIGSTGNDAVAANISAGTGINITNGAGSITISTTVAPVSWSNINASGTLVVNTGVNCTGGAALSLALPATSAVGDIIRVVLDGSTSWTITQAANQQIRVGAVTTTLGVGGSVSSIAQGDFIEMVCKTANLVWTAVGYTGLNVV